MVSSVFFFIAKSFRSAGAVAAQDDAGGEEGEPDHGQEENDVARVEHALLEAVEMGDDAERGDEVSEPAGGMFEQIHDRGEAGEDEEQTDHDGNDETDDLVAGHGGGDA